MSRKIKENLPSCTAILWTNTTLRDGTHPVKIRVTFKRKSKYYNVQSTANNTTQKLYLTVDQWNSARKENPRGKNKENKIQIDFALVSANEACTKVMENGKPFSLERFEAAYIAKESENGLMALFKHTLDDLFKEGRIGTYKTYGNAYNAFYAFRNGKDIEPADLTPRILKDFELYLRTPRKTHNRRTKKAASTNTVSIYIRALKVIYNIAVEENPALKEYYPFAVKQGDKKGYKIKAGSGKKGDAMTVGDLKKFIGLQTEPNTPKHTAKLTWLFLFYCQGMNFRDFAYLKYQNIKADCIEYIRRKTKDSENTESVIQVPLTEEISSIIVELGNEDKRPNSYVFNVINDKMDLDKQDRVIRQKIGLTNKWLKVLCEANDLPAITTYWARHSYASMLKDLNISVEMIRELLDHSDIRTTEAYLKRFDLGEKKKANDKIYANLKVS